MRVLDDAYNANADSVLAALQTLLDLPCKGRRIAVLGDMAELGAHTEAAHEEVGRAAAEMGVGQLFAIGKMAAATARGARAAGLNRVLEFPDVEAAMAAVKSFLKSGDLVLLESLARGAAGTDRRSVEIRRTLAVRSKIRHEQVSAPGGAEENRRRPQSNVLLPEPTVAGLVGRDALGGPALRACGCSATSPSAAPARPSPPWC